MRETGQRSGGALWIDAHAHLDSLSPEELAAQVGEAREAGVAAILATATDLVTSEKVVRQCGTCESLFGAVGISPFDARSLPDGWEPALRRLLACERIVAVGETGLDASNQKYPDVNIQLPAFERQLRLAAECGKAVVVHSRGAERQVAEQCRSHGMKRVLFHCYTGSADALETVLSYGFCVSFSGIVTFDASVRSLAGMVPLDRLFIETDSPYLSPAPYRGQTNRPARVSLVGEAVARCRRIDPTELQRAIAGNFTRLFGCRAES